ncbi:hypothetical protein COBT_000711 [Conglomerata obtusa]
MFVLYKKPFNKRTNIASPVSYYNRISPKTRPDFFSLPKLLISSLPLLVTCLISEDLFTKTLYHTLKSNGFTYMKLGQWLATRADLFSPKVCAKLAQLHSGAPKHSMKHTERMVSALNMHNLNVSSIILGSGCVAQTHYGMYGDRPVAIKVLHPGVRDMVRSDMAFLDYCISFLNYSISFLDYNFSYNHSNSNFIHSNNSLNHNTILDNNILFANHGISFLQKNALMNNITNYLNFNDSKFFSNCLNQFKADVFGQVDMRNEFCNLRILRTNFKYSDILIPEPLICSEDVLVMGFLPGIMLDEIRISCDNICEKKSILNFGNFSGPVIFKTWNKIEYNRFLRSVACCGNALWFELMQKFCNSYNSCKLYDYGFICSKMILDGKKYKKGINRNNMVIYDQQDAMENNRYIASEKHGRISQDTKSCKYQDKIANKNSISLNKNARNSQDTKSCNHQDVIANKNTTHKKHGIIGRNKRNKKSFVPKKNLDINNNDTKTCNCQAFMGEKDIIINNDQEILGEKNKKMHKNLKENINIIKIKSFTQNDINKIIWKCQNLFAKMIFIDQFVHCDLHPGNIAICPVTNKIILYDAGMCRYITENEHRNLLDLLYELIYKKDMRKAAELLVTRNKANYHLVTKTNKESQTMNIIKDLILMNKQDHKINNKTKNTLIKLEKNLYKNNELNKLKKFAEELANSINERSYNRLFSILRNYQVKLDYNYSSVLMSAICLDGAFNSLRKEPYLGLGKVLFLNVPVLYFIRKIF